MEIENFQNIMVNIFLPVIVSLIFLKNLSYRELERFSVRNFDLREKIRTVVIKAENVKRNVFCKLVALTSS